MTTITPYVTFGLIAVNVLAFLYESSLPPQYLDGFLRLCAVVPRELTLSFGGVMILSPFFGLWTSQLVKINNID